MASQSASKTNTRATSAPPTKRGGSFDRLSHRHLQLIWDPANAFILGDTPYPDGYRLLPHDRVLHVHVKDCMIREGRPVWGPPATWGSTGPVRLGRLRVTGTPGG